MEIESRPFMTGDVMSELNITPKQAARFMRSFGRKVCGHWIIEQRAFRRMQVDGTMVEWMSRGRGRPRKAR